MHRGNGASTTTPHSLNNRHPLSAPTCQTSHATNLPTKVTRLFIALFNSTGRSRTREREETQAGSGQHDRNARDPKYNASPTATEKTIRQGRSTATGADTAVHTMRTHQSDYRCRDVDVGTSTWYGWRAASTDAPSLRFFKPQLLVPYLALGMSAEAVRPPGRVAGVCSASRYWCMSRKMGVGAHWLWRLSAGVCDRGRSAAVVADLPRIVDVGAANPNRADQLLAAPVLKPVPSTIQADVVHVHGPVCAGEGAGGVSDGGGGACA